MALCTKCGTQLADDAKFCVSCGTSVEETVSEPKPETKNESASEKLPNKNMAEAKEKLNAVKEKANTGINKLPFKRMAEKIPTGARAKFPLLEKAIPFANQIACAFIVLVVAIIIICSVAGRGGSSGDGFGGSDSKPAQQAGISDTDEKPAAVHKSGPGGDYSYELISVHVGSITEESIYIYEYTGSGGAVRIPAKIENIQVVRIEASAFKGNKFITSVVIPEGVREIEKSAFEGCTRLESATIPASVKTISDSMFEDCTSLSRVTITEGVTTIGESAFDGCTSLASITIPKGVTIIGDLAFYGCTSLTNATLPDTVEEIGIGAFRECANLHTTNIPAGIKTIGRVAFTDCGELHSLTIPNSITAITWGSGENQRGETYYQQFNGSGKLPLAIRQRLSQLGYNRKDFTPPTWGN